MTEYPVTGLNRVQRLPKRGHYDRDVIYPIIDEALICHVGFVQDNQPFVIPTIHARRDDTLLLHGAVANRMLKHITGGNPVCVNITLVDGLVLARSVFHSSMNYRSVVLFGKGKALETNKEKLLAMEVITVHVARGRWNDARKPTQKELDVTTIISVSIEQASAKVRTGPPNDDDEDYQLPIWAGIVPLELCAGNPVADPKLSNDLPVPPYVMQYERPK